MSIKLSRLSGDVVVSESELGRTRCGIAGEKMKLRSAARIWRAAVMCWSIRW